MSWASKWIYGDEFPEGILVTLNRDGNSQRYVPVEERDMYRDLVDLMVHPDVCDQLKDENDKLRLLVRDLWLVAGLQDAIGELAIHAHGTDWRTFEERVSEALGLEEDA